jgi:hypothetical protein
MKNFIIFNSEKEGSCALVQTLRRFNEITIISDYIEPFDRHMFIKNPHASGKDISKEDFLKCLSLIYNSSENYLEELNRTYGHYNNQCRFLFSKDTCHGFKMRLRKDWKPQLFSLLKAHEVTAFVLIRQDVLRWALSHYHGDGTGKKGHLQFNRVTISALPKIKVSWRQLRKKIARCQRRIEDKKRLLQELRDAGVEAFPLYYEDFCNRKSDYLKNLFNKLDLTVTDRAIQQVITADCHVNKVHPDEISEFVQNHEHITKKFEDYMAQRRTPFQLLSFAMSHVLRR